MSSSLHARLKLPGCSKDDCLAAIRGEKVPFALGYPLIRLCIVRGIRYQVDANPEEFAKELYGVHPIFSRALNARRIMSNSLNLLPETLTTEETPYCIWYPRVASEGTYRELVGRYPQLKYQVGRACAVANYTDLYRELDILPDVHIAEEARDCGSTDIYNLIMAAPVRFDVMNDYNRSIDVEDPQQACLDGNTAVRWSLEQKQALDEPWYPDNDENDEDDEFEYNLFGWKGYEETTFNITEDMGIDEKENLLPARYDVAFLLSEPLPRDLPTTEKDLLILMAAYYGNIDRYARLRRPKWIPKELKCCIRGIYHNTQFARWWSRQPERPSDITKAINARFIMNNVLTTIIEPTGAGHLPYLIWYPTLAAKSTYRELYRLEPTMAPQILRACIVGGYKELFDEILAKTTPEAGITYEAKEKASHDDHYQDKLLERQAAVGTKRLEPFEAWKSGGTNNLERSTNRLCQAEWVEMITTEWESLYQGHNCDISAVDFMTCLPEDWKQKLIAEQNDPESDLPWAPLDYGFREKFQF